ncbi:GspH/FimT family pseudopilin [Neptunomonas qingdaonensis]|uniref:Type II secretion system protein H n=1 Tax=Neptunomonas qingdaonensis TaxID=1045558 RepID=A0A1I2VLQ7_9GAMM|nr:GspH/FimT family pseudopilin [Neptunomonas qingdaonensis]SFG89167.1 type IV fimbrial biogenesis protein FimT [Neptunomonas qingdaonensis]
MHREAHYKSLHSQFGFTLIELMVALAVSLILIVIGIPSWTHILARSDVTSTSLAIRAGLSIARSEAVKRGASVQVCSLDNVLTQCAGHVGIGRLMWGNGFIVFQDVDKDRVYTAGTDELLNLTHFSEPVDIDWGRGHYLIYAPSGRLQMGNSSFHIKHLASSLERHLILNNVGRVRSTDI